MCCRDPVVVDTDYWFRRQHQAVAVATASNAPRLARGSSDGMLLVRRWSSASSRSILYSQNRIRSRIRRPWVMAGNRDTPLGSDFLRVVQDQERRCEEKFDAWLPSAGIKAPKTVDALGTALSYLDRVASCWWGCDWSTDGRRTTPSWREARQADLRLPIGESAAGQAEKEPLASHKWALKQSPSRGSTHMSPLLRGWLLLLCALTLAGDRSYRYPIFSTARLVSGCAKPSLCGSVESAERSLATLVCVRQLSPLRPKVSG